MERIKLFYSSEIEDPWCHLKKIFSLLDKLKEASISIKRSLPPSLGGVGGGVPRIGTLSIEIIDTAEMKESERHRIYIEEAVYPSVLNRYRIGHIFGTQKISGLFFGKKQPCLLFYEVDAERATDVFPHTVKGQTITIEEFLEKKIEEIS